MDKVLQESVAEGEERRVMQAPNRRGVWSRSQQEREKAMVGPRFEQTIMEDQVGLKYSPNNQLGDRWFGKGGGRTREGRDGAKICHWQDGFSGAMGAAGRR